ncbi:MAG: sulfatase-like hydrolase/transferase, partial [Planctomycetales bacterium]|nr:sulfatase-like hydrolase/transferase [Planctomycetales bacterium]
TPHFNRLAAESAIFENCLALSPNVADAYAAWWTGRRPGVAESLWPGVDLPTQCAAHGVDAVLLTDDAEVAALPGAQAFARTRLLELPAASSCAEELEQTQLAQLFAAAIDELSRLKPPYLLWVHARGMAGAWDAPLALRSSLTGEDDPPPPESAATPSLVLAEDYDPDDLQGLACAYGGQVMLLDACLGALLQSLPAEAAADETLLAFTSPRGFPLGEHHIVGDGAVALYGELLQTPLLMRRAGGDGAMARLHELVQSSDLAPTLFDWLGMPHTDQPTLAASLLPLLEPARGAWPRDHVCICGPAQRAIRTAGWFLRESTGEGAPRHELFCKPDDRWEANEVADRCGEVVEQLLAALDKWRQKTAQGDFTAGDALPDELTAGAE